MEIEEEAKTQIQTQKKQFPTLGNKYILIANLGCGGNAVVKLGVLISEEGMALDKRKKFAIKLLDVLTEKVRAEFLFSQKCNVNEGYTIQAVELIESTNFNRIYGRVERKHAIVMEYAGKGDLFYHVNYSKEISKMLQLNQDENYFNEKMCRTLFLQLLLGIQQMHDQHFVHRDLKGDNLAMHESGRLRIIDFGWAIRAFNSQNQEIALDEYEIGTKKFLSPEVIEQKPYSGVALDLYQAGLILFFMYAQTYAFNLASTKDDWYKNFVNGNDRFWIDHNKLKQNKKPDYYSTKFQDLINKMLAHNPEQRLTLRNIQQHPWCQDEIYSQDQMAEIFNKIYTKYQQIVPNTIDKEIIDKTGDLMLSLQSTQSYEFSKEMKADYPQLKIERRVMMQKLPLTFMDLKLFISIDKAWVLLMSTLCRIRNESNQKVISCIIPSEKPSYKVLVIDEKNQLEFFIKCRQPTDIKDDVTIISFQKKNGDASSFCDIVREISAEINPKKFN